MSNEKATCTCCGNDWELRKPSEEIEMIRCSECGETGDSIQVETDEAEEGGSNELSAVERIELKERQTDLKKQSEVVAERIQRLGGSKVPEELEPTYRRLLAVSEELSDEAILSDTELDEIAEFIEEQEMQGDLDSVTEIKDLEARIEELQKEIEQLESRRDRLLEIVRVGELMIE